MSVFSTVHSILAFFQFMLILTHCIFPIFSAKPRGPLDVVHYRDVPGLDDALITVMIVKQTFGLVSKGFNLQKPRATYTSQNGVFTERVR